MAINFGLSERPTNNIIALFEAGQNAARQRVMQQREDQAYARQEGAFARQERQRERLAGAYDVSTGRVDPNAVRSAYLEAGDLKGYQDYAKSLQGDQAEAAKLIGQLALYADTPQKWDEAIDWAASRGASELLQYKGQFSEQNRMTALALGGQYDDYQRQNEPKWMAIGENGIVDVRDPAAIAAYQAAQSAGGSVSAAPSAVSSPSAGGAFSVNGLTGERVTSTFRTPERNAAVGGVPDSYHTRRDAFGNPMARDSVPPSGMGMDVYAAEIRRRNPKLEVINEGDHVHVEPRSSKRVGISKRDYDALPSGATFTAPDGTTRRKP